MKRVGEERWRGRGNEDDMGGEIILLRIIIITHDQNWDSYFSRDWAWRNMVRWRSSRISIVSLACSFMISLCFKINLCSFSFYLHIFYLLFSSILSYNYLILPYSPFFSFFILLFSTYNCSIFLISYSSCLTGWLLSSPNLLIAISARLNTFLLEQ